MGSTHISKKRRLYYKLHKMENLFLFLDKNYQHIAGENRFSNHPNKLGTKINTFQSTANLFKTVDTLENLNIKYTLVFGTLLGIYRDGQLIEHDTDSDIAVWFQDEYKIIELIKRLENKQLLLTRYTYCNGIFSFTCGGDYLDIYMCKQNKPGENILHFTGPSLGTLTPMDFDKKNTITFHNWNLPCVRDPEKHFQKLYGSDWKTPIKDKHAHIKHGNK